MANILFISLYSFRNFPVRMLHALAKQEGLNPVSVFLKDSAANKHYDISETEIDLLLKTIAGHKPQLILISVLTPYAIDAEKICERIRSATSVPIVLGGKYPTFFPHSALMFSDFVCVGEGEEVLKELAKRLLENKDIKGIKGLWHTEDGAIVDNGYGQQTLDLDSLPFQAIGGDDLLFIEHNITHPDPAVHEPTIWIMASRGCYYSCSYCINSLIIQKFKREYKIARLRSPRNIINEITYHLDLNKNAKSVLFVDELFGTSTKWTADFACLFKGEVNLPFACQTNPLLIKEHNIKLLADAGLSKLSMGLESASESIRVNILKRLGTNMELLNTTRVIKKYGIITNYDIIMENPFETVPDLEESIKFIIQLGEPISANIFRLQFFPGYPITKLAMEKGYISEHEASAANISRVVKTEWAFKPKRVSLNRKDQLQSAMYLILRNQKIGRRFAQHMSSNNNVALGFILSLAAQLYYWRTTSKLLLYFRNFFALLKSGQFCKIKEKILSHTCGGVPW